MTAGTYTVTETTLPTGWERRLRPLRAGRITALCLQAHDLIVSKLAAGRLKDLEFIAALFRFNLADPAAVRRHIRLWPIPSDRRRLRARLDQRRLASPGHRA